MKQFPCTQCGLCCLALDKIPVLHDFHHGDGKCIYYVQSQGCSIYHSRPLVCRIDEMYQTYFQKDFKKIDFYEKNAEVCNQLQQQHHYSESYRVKLKHE
ncbi:MULTISPECIES: YkgJ family cysteine cluster protein [Acinetobacter]|uniref:YkgJ family cysteine cluster protein n=1 Tax=Acinetobacter TaxID=469 RepID=UPI0012EFE617|nr:MULTISPECIES: YkgJ family cysteine cluster protein [Acinetobacter]MDV4313609.1 YkgJ family cysteine cluster protein [Acinetobacter indicus]MDN5490587.1 YkgJ family cysteine cluster protein [Acinetobacter sp.]MDN5626095.1 YkgJ family cysteine cluster protein [Acinetobacter sp.]MDN5649609.1 YkgJ family cysteine cluster protein [Acinetobacter sp.]CAD9196510.1 hypothetical protein QAC21B_02657 [Acinetobacter bohemicus]